jgi:GNAT superfamily N-acetyltransferase
MSEPAMDAHDEAVRAAASLPIVARPARPDDTDAIGRIHVRTWRAAYAGMLPERMLDGMDATLQSAAWSRVFRPTAVTRLVVAERGDELLGFAAYGPHREDDLGTDAGELYAIYVAPEAWRSGAGHALMDAVVAGLRAAGWSRGVLRVLEANDRARRFYEHEGWTFDRVTEPYDADGTPVPEIRYRRDLRPSM